MPQSAANKLPPVSVRTPTALMLEEANIKFDWLVETYLSLLKYDATVYHGVAGAGPASMKDPSGRVNNATTEPAGAVVDPRMPVLDATWVARESCTHVICELSLHACDSNKLSLHVTQISCPASQPVKGYSRGTATVGAVCQHHHSLLPGPYKAVCQHHHSLLPGPYASRVLITLPHRPHQLQRPGH